MGHLASYIATHFRPSGTPGRISKLRLLERREEQFEDCDLVDRERLIELLENDERIFTWDHDEQTLGDEIELVRVEGKPYLRVDGERLRADNLGELPEA